MTDKNCIDCGTTLSEPVEQNANYVISDRHTDEEEVEVVYGMKLTDYSKRRLDWMDELLEDRDRDAINAEMAHSDADETVQIPFGTKEVEQEEGGTVETADMREVAFSVPVGKYEHIEVDDPEVISDEDEIALTYSRREERAVQKTGLVCRDCLEADDEIIWGPDK